MKYPQITYGGKQGNQTFHGISTNSGADSAVTHLAGSYVQSHTPLFLAKKCTLVNVLLRAYILIYVTGSSHVQKH